MSKLNLEYHLPGVPEGKLGPGYVEFEHPAEPLIVERGKLASHPLFNTRPGLSATRNLALCYASDAIISTLLRTGSMPGSAFSKRKRLAKPEDVSSSSIPQTRQ